MNPVQTMNRKDFLRTLAPVPKPREAVAQPERATLAPYTPSSTKPWNRQRAAHLLRRTGMGAPPTAVDALLQQDPVAAVHAIVDEAAAAPLPPPPAWADQPINKEMNNSQKYEAQVLWLEQMRLGGFRERMAFFWSNHFVTASSNYKEAVYIYHYLTVLRTHALGNLKAFTYEVGLSPAMLIYLDGVKNKRSGPNENYARELCELFTMGIFNEAGERNYTQTDIEELARALTGLRVDDETRTSYLDDKQFDKGTKTFFERTGEFGYDDVVNIIFEERASSIAHNVAGQIYRAFVHAIPNAGIVSELAAIFLGNNFEIAPVMKALLSSDHFFEEAIIGASFKSPVDLFNGFIHEAGVTLDEEGLREVFDDMDRLGQELFDPPSVAGWPGYHSWMSTGSLPLRWSNMLKLIYGTDGYNVLDVMPLARQTSNPEDPYILTRELTDTFLSQPMSEEEYSVLTEVLLDGIPDYEWSTEVTGADERLRGLLAYIVQLPEFQLT